MRIAKTVRTVSRCDIPNNNPVCAFDKFIICLIGPKLIFCDFGSSCPSMSESTKKYDIKLNLM